MLKSLRIIFIFLLPLFAKSQTVDFNYTSTNGLFCNPAIIQFTQNITGSPSGFIWNLGNGLTTSQANPITSYTIAGSYTVKLVVIFPSGPVQISKTIVITPTISPNIVPDRDYICQPGVINFTAPTNGNITSYDWDFGDQSGISSTSTNINTHSFAKFGTFSAIVKAVAGNGCFGQDTVQIIVKKLPILATTNPSSGCLPATVKFVSNVTVPANDGVSNYSWNFGDGQPPTSTTAGSVNFPVTKVGTYAPKLTVTTNEGCTNTFNFKSIAFGIPPIRITSYPKLPEICGSDSAVFVSKATNANRYLWNFGDGDTLSVTDTVVKHKYSTLGINTVTVTPFFNDCPGVSTSFSITVKGVIANFTARDYCIDKKTFSLIYSGLGDRTNINWDLGDGSPPSSDPRITHTYPSAGEFKTTVTVIDPNSACRDTFSRIVYTGDPILVNADVAICINTATTFTIDNNYTNPDATFTWNVGGKIINTRTRPNVTVTTDSLGNFNNFLYIKNGPGYCIDTIALNHSMVVRGPKLDFTAPANICFGDLATITNNSKPFVSADSIVSSLWNYGNLLPTDTRYQPDAVLFVSPGTFTLRLTEIDKNGCKDSLAKVITVNPLPFLQVLPGIDTLCSGRKDTLYAIHSDNILWSPAAGLSCTTCDTVIANPSITTQYFITATTASNCSIRDSILVNVAQPFTVVPPGNQFVCLGGQVVLDMNPKDKIIVWSPSNNLSNVNIYNPGANPTETTTYTATLTDSIGCFTKTGDVTVFINNSPTVDAGPDKVVPYNSNFNLAPVFSNNISSYLWTPSTTLNCTACAITSGIAVNTQTYTITVTSDSGCVASDSVTVIIECKESNIFMPSAFTPNDDNLNDYFYPITRGIKTILKFIIYNREGKVMYEDKNFPPNNKTAGWDGRYKGIRQSATGYVYILEAMCEQGEKLTKSGSILLLR